MDIRDYYEIIKKNIAYILLITIVFAAVAMIATIRKAPVFQSSATIEITKSAGNSQANVPYYQYDNYYSVQAASALSDNIIGLANGPATVAEIFQKSGYDLPTGDLKALSKVFTAKKYVTTSGVIELSYSSENQQMAKDLINAATSVLKDKISQYNTTDNNGKFAILTGSPVIIEAPKATALNTVIAAFVGLFVSLGLVFFREALKR